MLLIAINDVALNKDRKRPNYVPKRLKIAALVVKISPKKIGGDVVVQCYWYQVRENLIVVFL